MRRLRDSLQDILDAISKIEVQQAKGKDAIETDALLQAWMAHHRMITASRMDETEILCRLRRAENNPPTIAVHTWIYPDGLPVRGIRQS